MAIFPLRAPRGKPLCLCVAALGGLSGALLSSAAFAVCSNPAPAATMPVLTWGPAAICSGLSAGAGFSSMMTTLNTSVFTQTSAFIASPTSDKPSVVSNGLWVRGIGGQTTIDANASSTSAAWGTYTDSSRVRTTYGGVQAGLDTGWLNLGATGLNAHFGVTGGYVGAKASERLGGDRLDIQAPFIGAYGAFYYGNLVADFQIRRDFYNVDWTSALSGPGAASASAGAWTISGSLGYRIDLGSFFIEPSVGLDYSRLSIDNIAVPGGGPFFVPAGVYQFNDIESTLGRAGVRVRMIVDMGNDFFLQPFAIASINHEFAGAASFQYVSPPFAALPVSVDRVGTFGQFSLGVAALSLKSNLTGYLRADLRVGEKISGQSLSAALRYQF